MVAASHKFETAAMTQSTSGQSMLKAKRTMVIILKKPAKFIEYLSVNEKVRMTAAAPSRQSG